MIIASYKNNMILLTAQSYEDYNRLCCLDLRNHVTVVREKNGVFEIPAYEHANLNALFAPTNFEGVDVDESYTKWKETRESGAVLIKCGVCYSRLHPPAVMKLPVKEIEDATHFFLKAAVNSDKYKSGRWDGYINLYDRRIKQFPTGLLTNVIEVFDKSNIPYQIEYIYDTHPKRMFDWKVEDGLIPDPDQLDAIQAAIDGHRGIIKAPTGFGKTAILAKRLTASFGLPTLFVANKKSLLDDAADEFRFGITGLSHNDVIQIKDGWFGNVKLDNSVCEDDIPNIEAPIVVATIQSLHARLQDPRTKGSLLSWLRNTCKFLMIDETQAVGTTMWDEVLYKCNAPYRIALSATPRRTDGGTIKIQACSGPWLYSTTAAEQIEKGRLCELEINYQEYDHKLYNEDDKNLVYSEMYRMCIVENEERNRTQIIEPTMKMLEEERLVLVLVTSIDHGHILEKMFYEAGLNPEDVRFIWGDTPDKTRTNAIKEFRKGAFKVLIGSTIFDAGVNIPVISGIVLAGAGNSDITLIQRIGRGARNADYEKIFGELPEFMKKSSGKKVTKVYDTIDTNVKFFHRQSRNRYYNAREEFGADRVHILGDKSAIRYKKKSEKEIKKQVDQVSAQLEMLSEFAR